MDQDTRTSKKESANSKSFQKIVVPLHCFLNNPNIHFTMNTASVFNIRQLTEYREWPDSRKGYLVYIPEKSYLIHHGGIFIVDSLSQESYNKISPSNCVIEGFGALIYSLKWSEFDDSKIKNNYWKIYKNWLKKNTDKDTNDVDTIIRECRYWLNRNKLLLTELWDGYTGDKDHLFDQIILHKMQELSRSYRVLMWELSPTIRIPNPNNTRTAYMHYMQCDSKSILYLMHNEKDEEEDYKNCYCISHDKKILAGFEARFINFVTAYYVCDRLRLTPSPDKCAMDIVYSLDELKEGWIAFQEINFAFEELDCQKTYDEYIKTQSIPIIKNLKRDSSYVISSDQTKIQRMYKCLFKEEAGLYDRERQIDSYLSKEQAQTLYAYTRDFFRYLLLHIEGDAEELQYTEQFYSLFPDGKHNTTIDQPQSVYNNLPLLRNSFHGKLALVYDILVTNNYVMPNNEELFEKIMTFQVQTDERLVWKGKVYELASFIYYAYEGSGENTWNAACFWKIKNKDQNPKLKNNYNRSTNDESIAEWRKRFKDI